MENNNIIREIIETITNQKLKKLTAANFRNKNEELDKIIATLILVKNKPHIQFEYRYKRIIKHKNIDITKNEAIKLELEQLFLTAKDINIQTENHEINIKISKKHKLSISRKVVNHKINISMQNRKKSYLLDPNKIYPFLIELGIQSKAGKIKNDKHFKFKQINKYLEFIEHAIKKLDQKEITILDFGSGKSYLTFAIYHYIVNELGINAKIVGIDLKKEVIENCNAIAQKLNFKQLEFICGDVANFDTKYQVDMLISLHARDTATDIAILKSLQLNAKVVFAVPCCQKEINKQLKIETMPLLLKHGIVKEKFATLLTDAIRSEILESCGFKSEIIEFISEENTPKNMMIRAFKEKNEINSEKLKYIDTYLQSMGLKMMLVEEIKTMIKSI